MPYAAQLVQAAQETPPDRTAEVQHLAAANAALEDELAALQHRASASAAAAAHAARASRDVDEIHDEVEELRAENVALAERAAAAEADMQELRLSHKREVRQRGREVAQLREDLAQARGHLRELRIKNRDLHAVRPASLLALQCTPVCEVYAVATLRTEV
jgi:predicted RNase H-like nuclease (RuvC/YqgF family)